MICKICGNSEENKPHKVKEMMFGTREEFDYSECSKCNCVQLLKPPEDMTKHYPHEYNAYTPLSVPSKISGVLKRALRQKRNFSDLTGRGILGNFLNYLFPSTLFKILRKTGIRPQSKILDVGCGTGILINDLHDMGYKQVLGVDPFIEKDIIYSNGVRIMKKYLNEVQDQFDLVMFHHSFEHLPNPLETLQSLSNNLTKESKCIIRIPTVSSYAWEHYGVNWVALDAPRHIFIHSLESMNILISKADLKLDEVIFDSTFYQFWASEQFKRNIPLNSEISFSVNPRKSIFSKQSIKDFKRRAERLNREKRGDWIALIISPA